LKTRSLAVARRERHAAIAEFQAILKIARAKLGGADATSEALSWRHHLSMTDDAEAKEAVEGLVEDRAYEIEEELGEDAAVAFADAAFGRATPLAACVDDWLSDSSYRGRTQGDHHRAISRLSSWLTSQRLPVTIEGVTRKVAGQFAMNGLKEGGIAPKTVNKYLSSLSSYWEWLERRGHAEANPWLRQSVSVKGASAAAAAAGAQERPFTDEEVSRLLSGPAEQELRDVMLLLALSGLRIEEVYQLRVSDCGGGCFAVRRSKTAAGTRVVPIHSALQAIVSRLVESRQPDAFLIEKGSASAERSMAMSKRIGRYRQAVGVDVRVEGKRRSLVNAHSFRRWFITKAERAGQAENIIASVVGHKRPGMTFGVYSGGPSAEQLRACVEAVRLPD
jgi:integrase